MKGNLFKEFGTYSQFITQSHFETINDFVKVKIVFKRAAVGV